MPAVIEFFLCFISQLGLFSTKGQFLRPMFAVVGFFLCFIPQFGLCGARGQFSRLVPALVGFFLCFVDVTFRLISFVRYLGLWPYWCFLAY